MNRAVPASLDISAASRATLSRSIVYFVERSAMLNRPGLEPYSNCEFGRNLRVNYLNRPPSPAFGMDSQITKTRLPP